MSFIEAYKEWEIYASSRHKKQGFETLRQNFKKNVLSYFKGVNIQNISVKEVIAWQNNIYEKGFSNNYNKNIYSAFNSFLNYCVLNSYIETNYLSVVGTFNKKVEYKYYKIYNYFEFKKFRKGVKDRIYRYFFDLLYFYGLRSGEAMALKFTDLQGKKLHVGHSIQRCGKREIDSPKTANSNRILNLDIIMRFKLFILKCFYVKNFGESFDYFIFGGAKPLSATTIKRKKHEACVNRRIKEIKIHEFRHSCATRWIRKKIPMERVSKMLGHSSIAITMDIYVHNEKKEVFSLFPKIDFFETLRQNFKKILQSIITQIV